MNAHTHLLSQGWLGPGHTLQPSHPDGLKKHLLVSQKNDTCGVGKKKHDAHADQWWLRAFDNALKDINFGALDGVHPPKVVTKTLGPRIETLKLGKWFRNGGLYAGFVRGEGMEGTLQEAETEPASEIEAEEIGKAEAKRKRKRDHSRPPKHGHVRKKRKSHVSRCVQDDRIDMSENGRVRGPGTINTEASASNSTIDGTDETLPGLVDDSVAGAKEQRRQRRKAKRLRKAERLDAASGQSSPPKPKGKRAYKSKHKSSQQGREAG